MRSFDPVVDTVAHQSPVHAFLAHVQSLAQQPVRPAEVLHAAGQDAAARQVWMENHPGALHGHATGIPAWVRSGLTFPQAPSPTIGPLLSRLLGEQNLVALMRRVAAARPQPLPSPIPPSPGIHYFGPPGVAPGGVPGGRPTPNPDLTF